MKLTIYSPGYHSAVGGIIALHKLCHLMNEMGINASLWLIDGTTNPGWNTPVLYDFDFNVVIYPEIIVGNPLMAKKVVRWCLNTPGRLGGPVQYPPDDIVFYFWDYFAPEGSDNILTVLELQDCWKDYGNKRSGYCYSERKGGTLEHKDGAVDVGNVGNYQRLADTFNRFEYFYTNDDRTFLSQQAAMCGCISVVDSEGDANEWRRRMSINDVGVAFGWGENEIRYANDTKHLVRENIEKIQSKTEEQIKWLLECIK